MRRNLFEFIFEFMAMGRIKKGLISSFIALKLKVDSLMSLKEYCLISLINSLYKILAKLLANRLKKVIHSMISDTQSAFISGWQIINNILLTNKIIYNMKKGLHNCEGLVFWLWNAFHCVGWYFLLWVMKAMGFGSLWRKWIFKYISSVHVSILVNGLAIVEFRRRRGLWQSDPLSSSWLLKFFIFFILKLKLKAFFEAPHYHQTTPFFLWNWEPTMLSLLKKSSDASRSLLGYGLILANHVFIWLAFQSFL